MKTTSKDVAQGNVDKRQWHNDGYTSQMGRSFYWITCPFCGVTFKAYLWSLAGCGKRCECGALFDNYGNTYRKKGAGRKRAVIRHRRKPNPKRQKKVATIEVKPTTDWEGPTRFTG